MERMEAHRSCYRRALSLFKEECGLVMTCCFSVLLAVVLQVTVGYSVSLYLPNSWIQMAILIVLELFLFFALTGPLLLGIGRWFYYLPQRQVPLRELFYYLESKEAYQRGVQFLFDLIWRILLTVAICCLPAVLLKLLLDQLGNSSVGVGVLYSIVLVLQAILLVVGIAVALYHLIRYFLAAFLFFEQADTAPVHCVRYSYDLMQERRFDVLMLLVSLFPVYLTWVLVLPIVFTVPYLLLLCSLKGRELLEESLHTT